MALFINSLSIIINIMYEMKKFYALYYLCVYKSKKESCYHAAFNFNQCRITYTVKNTRKLVLTVACGSIVSGYLKFLEITFYRFCCR